MTLGIGTERILQEINEKIPDLKMYIFDKHHIVTPKEAKAVIAKFYSTPGSILVGTEMALPYLDRPIQNSAIASIDALFSIPDFKISEKILGTILKIRAITQSRLLLQTRNPEQKILTYAMAGNIVDFYREEIEMRHAFQYPPFSVLVKLSIEGDKDAIVQEMGRAKQMFEKYEMDVFPSFVKGKRGQSTLHALIKIPHKEWPDQKLVELLRFLPPQFTIKINPESLL